MTVSVFFKEEINALKRLEDVTDTPLRTNLILLRNNVISQMLHIDLHHANVIFLDHF